MSGGVNGVNLKWEECETEYNASKGVECYERLKKNYGGASTVEPLSTGIAYGLFSRVAEDKIPMTTFGYGLASSADGRVYDRVFPLGTTYWDQMAAMIAYLGQKEGGLDKLKGKKIAFLYHDSAYGKEPIPVLDALSTKLGYEVLKIAVTPPGQTAGIAVAANPPGQARLRDRVDLRRDEHGGIEDRCKDWLSARQAARCVVGRLGRRRGPCRRCRQGLRQRHLFRTGHQFPGGTGHQVEGLRRQEGQPRGSKPAR
jgi:hypothetical protein